MDAPPLTEMQKALRSSKFREQVAEYITRLCQEEPAAGEVLSEQNQAHIEDRQANSMIVQEDGHWKVAQSDMKFNCYNPMISQIIASPHRVYFLTNSMSTKTDVGLLGSFLSAPRSQVPEPSATISTLLGDVWRQVLMPKWMDQHNHSA